MDKMIRIIDPEFDMTFCAGSGKIVESVLRAIWRRYQRKDRQNWVLEIRIGNILHKGYLFSGDGRPCTRDTLEEMIEECVGFVGFTCEVE